MDLRFVKSAMDSSFMRVALQLSFKGKKLTKTNPWVGCIIVRNNIVIGRGYHEKFGGPHAEVNAINDILNFYGADSKQIFLESTLYSTLEPCCHTNKKTPPCTDLILKWGIKKIKIGILDPDPNVAGRGIKLLEDNGCEVEWGICSEEITQSLKPYIFHRQNKIPYTILKISCSLDGKISSNNLRTDITNLKIKDHTYSLREESQAVLAGYNTVIIDNPQLTSRRNGEYHQPIRVILNNRGLNIPLDYHIFDTTTARTLMIIPEFTDPDLITLWHSKNVETEILPLTDNHFNLSDVKKLLYGYNIMQLLIEGGAKLASAVIKSNEWNQIVLNYGNSIIGSHGIGWSDNIDTTLSGYDITKCEKMDNNIQIIFQNNLYHINCAQC
jgi:diaminohydroxyphosphoribosylaminopyrimidine deaminase/5-amino-6-(5-phosphoribosylamino)uracil reductase